MRRAVKVGLIGIAVAASVGATVPPARAAEGDDALLGPALATLFNPRSAPSQKTMGLLQRSFLDLVEESQPKLEIAFVIDGTDSMAGQLESVRQSLVAMMNDLELYKENNISYQLIVYRDTGSPSGAVELPIKAAGNAFVADREVLLAAINAMKAESGAPYFPERVDEGLHAALADLAWSTADDVSRWVFLIGDAPPFDESFDEPQNQAGRRYGTGALVALAAEKGVHVNCILCTSDPEDLDPHEQLLDQTRRFMGTLSEKTGGLMLDLSYDDIRDAVRKAAPRSEVGYERIGWIRQDDVEAARRHAVSIESTFAPNRRLRVAILPHLPLDKMTFDPKNEAVQLARELRIRLRALPGIEFKDAGTVKDRFRLVSRQGVQGDALLQMLATALDVDYVVWGTMKRTGEVVEATTAIYDQAAGRRLAEARMASNPTTPAAELGAALTATLVKSNGRNLADQRLRGAFASLAQDQARSNLLVVPVALDAAKPALLEGAEALEQSLALPVDAPEAAELLNSARSSLQRAVEADPENALARFLLSSALFNQARAKQLAGDLDAARTLMADFAKQLREAFRLRDKGADESLRTEIEADHALLVRGNAADAIALYRRLLTESQTPDADAARHAQWMLAGIYSGDWGVDPKVVDRDAAKQALTQILALWPDSSEAQFIRRALRWDDEGGGSRFPNFPRENGELAEMVDRSA